MLATALSRTATAKMKLVLPAIAKKDHVRIRGKTLLADQTARSAGPIYLVRNVCVNWPTGLKKKNNLQANLIGAPHISKLACRFSEG